MKLASLSLALTVLAACNSQPSPTLAAGETSITWGLSPGANPRGLCVFDTSHTCVGLGTLDSVLHTLTIGATECKSLILSGAAGDGVTDDTVKINNYLATFTKGSCIQVPANKWYLINSNNLTIPAGIIVQGASSGLTNTTGGNPQATGGGFLLNPSYSITLNNAAQLLNLSVERAGLISNPTPPQSNAAVTQWGNETSVGVMIPRNQSGVVIDGVYVIGFNTCFRTEAGRYFLSRSAGDCWNGLVDVQGGDIHSINDVWFEPFYSLADGDGTTLGRPGVAFNFFGGVNGYYCHHCMSYMFATGILIQNTGGGTVSDSAVEFHDSLATNFGITNSRAIRLINAATPTIQNVTIQGFDNGVEAIAGQYQLNNIALYAVPTQGFILGGGNAAPTIITVTGTVALGNTLTATITSAGLVGSPLTITYTANSVDTTGPAYMARGLTNAINTNLALQQAGIWASFSGAVATIGWPAASTVTVVAGGTQTSTTSTGTACTQSCPAHGHITNPFLNYGDVPHGFLLQPGMGWWNISAPYWGQNGSIPAGWINAVNGDGTTLQHLRFSGMTWSTVLGANFSACGSGGAANITGSSDGSGNFTETNTATGCTLTFTTPWPYAPVCTVSNQDGLAGAFTWTISATQLVISQANASGIGGIKFNYRCNLPGSN